MFPIRPLNSYRNLLSGRGAAPSCGCSRFAGPGGYGDLPAPSPYNRQAGDPWNLPLSGFGAADLGTHFGPHVSSCASAKALMAYFTWAGLGAAAAAAAVAEVRALCAADKPRAALEAADRHANQHGVEHIRNRAGRATYYVNGGDTYSPTLAWSLGGQLRVLMGGWGPLVEAGGYDGLGFTPGFGAPPARPTYAVAREALWRAFGQIGWKLSAPGLAVLHATAADGRMRVWFKAQALYSESGGAPWNMGSAHSLFVADIRDIRDYRTAAERIARSLGR